MPTFTTYFTQIILFVLDREFAECCEITAFCHNSVSRNITR